MGRRNSRMDRYMAAQAAIANDDTGSYSGGSDFNEDGGYAHWNGQSVYWDKEDAYGNVINIFPGGMPPRSHHTHDHDHIKVRGASISSLGGQTIITGGYVIYSRINGVES